MGPLYPNSGYNLVTIKKHITSGNIQVCSVETSTQFLWSYPASDYNTFFKTLCWDMFVSLPHGHQNADQWSKPGLIILVGGSCIKSWVSRYKKCGIKDERKHAPTRMNVRSWHCYILLVPYKINKFNIELYQPTIHSLSLLDSGESTRISMESISPTFSRWGVFTRAGRDAFWWGNPEHRRCHESLGEMDLERGSLYDWNSIISTKKSRLINFGHKIFFWLCLGCNGSRGRMQSNQLKADRN